MLSVSRLKPLVIGFCFFALSACINVGDPRDQGVRNYEASTREEADWLWNNMNYVRTHFYPDDAYCKPEFFSRQAVLLTPEQRANDPRTASLVDQLDYAATLIQQAHDEWDRFCRRESSAPTTVQVLERRLMPAYASMNAVRVALLPDQSTPLPGST